MARKLNCVDKYNISWDAFAFVIFSAFSEFVVRWERTAASGCARGMGLACLGV